jgi:hypothetical protein
MINIFFAFFITFNPLANYSSITVHSRLAKKDKKFVYFDIYITNNTSDTIFGIPLPKSLSTAYSHYNMYCVDKTDLYKRYYWNLTTYMGFNDKKMIRILLENTRRHKSFGFRALGIGSRIPICDSDGFGITDERPYHQRDVNDMDSSILHHLYPKSTLYYGLKINRKYYRMTKSIILDPYVDIYFVKAEKILTKIFTTTVVWGDPHCWTYDFDYNNYKPYYQFDSYSYPHPETKLKGKVKRNKKKQ